MKEKLRLVLKGGLGNQLFQYFAGEELSRFYRRKLIVDVSWFERNIHKNGLLDKRNYLLGQYKFGKTLQITSEFSWKNSPKMERIIRKLPKHVGNFAGFYEEMSKDEKDYLFRDEITTFGHWVMTPILPKKEILKKKLVEGIANPSHGYMSLRESLLKKKVIAIHHRLGDYKNFGHYYGVIDENYFSNAIKRIEEIAKFKNHEVWLFSDEPKLSSSLLSKRFEISKVISDRYEINESETIALISQAAGIVCSNSTFSWWAAFLSDESTSSVVFPEYYMNDILTRNTGLYVRDWNYL